MKLVWGFLLREGDVIVVIVAILRLRVFTGNTDYYNKILPHIYEGLDPVCVKF